jgi:hypothetical protein
MKLEFGQKITVTHKLKRKTNWLSLKRQYYNYWNIIDIDPCEVLVIGKRNLRDGYVNDIEYEGKYFNINECFTAYLVVKNMNENPFYVLS